MSTLLAGKVALVTGAARGIGRAIALKLGGRRLRRASRTTTAATPRRSRSATSCAAMGRRGVRAAGQRCRPGAASTQMFAALSRAVPARSTSSSATPPAACCVRRRADAEALALVPGDQRPRASPRSRTAPAPLMPRGRTHHRPVEPRRLARAARLRLRRRLEGRARVAGPRLALRARPARHPRQRRAAPAWSTPTRCAPSRSRDAMLAEFAARDAAGASADAPPTSPTPSTFSACPRARMITGQTLVVDGGYSIVG